MPLHITKIAFRSESAANLRAWLESHASEGGDSDARIVTRYLPKRHEEMLGGSLYWLLSSQLIGRSPLLGFEERTDGRYWIRLAPLLIPVVPRPKRAHQGWRYLEDEDAPPDLGGSDDGDALPDDLASELGRLGLL